MLALCVCGVAVSGSSTFTRKSAETFTGKQGLEDAFRSLELDYRNSRDALAILGIDSDDFAVYWKWGADSDTAPPSIEFHLEDGQFLVIDAASGALLTYLRYGAYWVAPGSPGEFAPERPKEKADAMPEGTAAEAAYKLLKKFYPDAAWQPQAPVYKDRFDVVPGDLYGAWWEFGFERIYQGYPARGADAEICLNAETGELMRCVLPAFEPPASVEIYFPPENARIKAEDYLTLAPNTLQDLLQYRPSQPEQQIQDTGGNFDVLGGLTGNRAQRKAAKRETKQSKKEKSDDGNGGEATSDSIPTAIAPELVQGAPTPALALVSEVWKQQTWQPLDPTQPEKPRYLLVYEFPTQTPTALTLPVLVTTAGNEVVR